MGSCVEMEVTERDASSLGGTLWTRASRSCSRVSLRPPGEPRGQLASLSCFTVCSRKALLPASTMSCSHASLTTRRAALLEGALRPRWGAQALPERTGSGPSAPPAKGPPWPCWHGDRVPLFGGSGLVLQGSVHFIYTEMSYPSCSRRL